MKQLLSLENWLSVSDRLYRGIKSNTAAALGCVVVFGLSVLGYKVVYLACRKQSSFLCRALCTLSAPLVLPVCALVTWALTTTVLEFFNLPIYETFSRLPEVLAVSWLDHRWFAFVTDVFHSIVSMPIKNQPYLASAEFMAMSVVLSVFPVACAAFTWRPCKQQAAGATGEE
ncbi:MAG: hypothetical protein ACR2PT_05655 [Endozoicomonas sp.]